ncbi:Condensin-2 complex subunit H2 [Parelaphostrongylus tenuis]|uniref:Condensin-2 complex subunit H2 n=1 Tax=Parelaphostrongylus tenuis TaxID=148309 RepID=A0AAD5QX53_PARTN|nr:Condensin-2 complex subunit H2 [Parelaphostrongylus tenuis]
MGEDFEGAGQRYLYLLKPVKDLSKNFETDIAKELDDYCSSLREITSNEDLSVNNQHRFNFAEAAMLIQGSAFVFW